MGELLQWIGVRDGVPFVNPESNKRLLDQIGPEEKLGIVSISGKSRQGKTFFMNILLKAFKNDAKAHFEQDETIGGPENFPFQSGDDGHTMGIMAYSVVFHKKTSGGTLAVILVDTQGTFDLDHKEEVPLKLFAISSLISSITIFNTEKRLSRDNLDALTSMVGFSHSTQSQLGSHLIILVRDSHPKKCGFKGESANLHKLKNGAGNETLFQGIYKAYEVVETYNAPCPSEAVRYADGSLLVEECGKKFINALCELANHIVDKLKPTDLTKATLPIYLQKLVKHLSISNQTTYLTAHEATVEMSAVEATSIAHKNFKENYDQLTGNGRKPVDPQDFPRHLEEFKEKAIKHFFGGLYGFEFEKEKKLEQFKAYFQTMCNNASARNMEVWVMFKEEERRRQEDERRRRELREEEKRRREELREEEKRLRAELRREENCLHLEHLQRLLQQLLEENCRRQELQQNEERLRQELRQKEERLHQQLLEENRRRQELQQNEERLRQEQNQLRQAEIEMEERRREWDEDESYERNCFGAAFSRAFGLDPAISQTGH